MKTKFGFFCFLVITSLVSVSFALGEESKKDIRKSRTHTRQLVSATVTYRNGEKTTVQNPYFTARSNPGYTPPRYGNINYLKYSKEENVGKHTSTTKYQKINVSEIEMINVVKGKSNYYSIIRLSNGKKMLLSNTRPLELGKDIVNELEYVDYWLDTEPILNGDVRINNSTGKFNASLVYDTFGPEGIAAVIFNYK